MSEPPVMRALRDVYEDSVDARDRIAELEALLDRARYILANNAAEGDAAAGVLVNDINAAMAVRT